MVINVYVVPGAVKTQTSLGYVRLLMPSYAPARSGVSGESGVLNDARMPISCCCRGRWEVRINSPIGVARLIAAAAAIATAGGRQSGGTDQVALVAVDQLACLAMLKNAESKPSSLAKIWVAAPTSALLRESTPRRRIARVRRQIDRGA